MPFGLVNDPMTVQRVMDVLLNGINWQFVLVYIDDLCVLSKTFKEHLSHLKLVFDRLGEHNLHLKLSKCYFCQTHFDYLGHVVSSEGISTDPKKIACIKDSKPPTNQDEVHSWLGLIGYYRRFVHNYSKISEPIRRLKKKSEPFVWEKEQQDAFECLIEKLTTAPILCFPDFDKPFLLQVDASRQGIGAVLAQVGTDGNEHVCAYASNSLNVAQQKYSTI